MSTRAESTRRRSTEEMPASVPVSVGQKERLFPTPQAVALQIVEDGEKIVQGIGSSLAIVAEGFLLGGERRRARP